MEVTETLLPLLRASPSGARIVTISSLVGRLANVNDVELRKKLADVTQFDQKLLDKLAQEFLEACRAGNGERYANTAYRFSKTLLNAYGRLLAQRVAFRGAESGVPRIYVHGAHPGFVMTGMHRKFLQHLDEETYAAQLASGQFSRDGVIGVEDGADTPVWLCLLPPGISRRLASYGTHGKT